MRAEPLIASSRTARVLALVAVVLAASCGSDSGPTEPVPADEVRVQNNSFSPSSRTVTAGTTVTFRWNGNTNPHNVTFAGGPASGDQTSGTYQRLFANAGTFTYQCTNHAGMNGTITVN